MADAPDPRTPLDATTSGHPTGDSNRAAAAPFQPTGDDGHGAGATDGGSPHLGASDEDVSADAPAAIADPSGYGDATTGAALARSIAEAQVAGPSGSGAAVATGPGGRFVVGTVDEIPPGARKLVLVDGREIGVFNVGGEYFAVLNRCPHQGGPLCNGRQVGFLVSPVPGEFEMSRPGEVIRCPWHGWEFDLRTGQSWCEPARVRVRRYEVSVQPGTALAPPATVDREQTGVAEVAAGVPGDGVTVPAGLVRGPYTAETYPVSVDHQYIVLELPPRRP